MSMGTLRKRNTGRTLAEGFATGQRQAVQQRILADLCEDLTRIDIFSPGKIVGLGIVAAGTVVWAALRENDKADAGAIDD